MKRSFRFVHRQRIERPGYRIQQHALFSDPGVVGHGRPNPSRQQFDFPMVSSVNRFSSMSQDNETVDSSLESSPFSIDEWKISVQNISDRPVGSFDDAAWKEVDQTLRYWIYLSPSLQRETRKDYDEKMLDGVNQSLSLLERVVCEEKIDLKNPLDLLNGVILTWKNAFLNSTEHSTHLLLPKPSRILSIIDMLNEKAADTFRPNHATYTLILETAAMVAKHDKNNHEEGVHFARSLLDRICEESKLYPSIRPTSFAFGAVMNAWVHSQLPNSPEEVNKLMGRLSALHEDGWPDSRPDVPLFNMQLKAYAVSGQPEHAEDLLNLQIERSRNDDSEIEPDCTSYSTVIDAYGDASQPEHAEALLLSMQERYENGNIVFKPNLITYTSVIKAWALKGNVDRAEQILRLLEEYSKEDADLQPDVVVYNMLLLAYARQGQPQKAYDLLCLMLKDHSASPSASSPTLSPSVYPNKRAFNIVLSALAKEGSADFAEAVLTQMHGMHKSGHLEFGPDIVSYNSVLDAWANAKRKLAWKRADLILNHMLELYARGDDSLKPSIITFNTVLSCFAKAGKIREAESLFNGLLEKDGGPGSKLSELVGIANLPKPNLRTWNTVLACYARRGHFDKATAHISRMQQKSISPDVISYNTLLNCFAKRGDRDAAKHAQTVFSRMTLNEATKPNRTSCSTLLDAILKSGNAERAEAWLLEWCGESKVSTGKAVDVKPDVGLFHQVLDEWAHISPRRAESLLLKMVELYDTGTVDIKPRTETFNRVLKSWALSKNQESGSRAELMLRQMEKQATKGEKTIQPDLISFNSVLNAWANSGDPTAVTHVENLVLEMIMKGRDDLIPTDATYGTWLKAISLASDDNATKRRQKQAVVKMMKAHGFNTSSDHILKQISELM